MEPKVISEMTMGRKSDFISDKTIGIYKRVARRLIEKKFFVQTIALKKIICHLRLFQAQDHQDKAMEKIVLARLNEQMLREDSKNY